MKYNLILFFLLLLTWGCNDPTDDAVKGNQYFDIKGYFEKEALRLTRSKPLIQKTVMVNDSSETKELKIADWKAEFSVFADADINRSAWRGLFRTKNNDGQETYSSDNEKVPVKEVQVFKKDGKIKGLQILIRNANSLYTSADTLSYYPDSIYEIRKAQHIRLLSGKSYQITGRFK